MKLRLRHVRFISLINVDVSVFRDETPLTLEILHSDKVLVSAASPSCVTPCWNLSTVDWYEIPEAGNQQEVTLRIAKSGDQSSREVISRDLLFSSFVKVPLQEFASASAFPQHTLKIETTAASGHGAYILLEREVADVVTLMSKTSHASLSELDSINDLSEAAHTEARHEKQEPASKHSYSELDCGRLFSSSQALQAAKQQIASLQQQFLVLTRSLASGREEMFAVELRQVEYSVVAAQLGECDGVPSSNDCSTPDTTDKYHQVTHETTVTNGDHTTNGGISENGGTPLNVSSPNTTSATYSALLRVTDCNKAGPSAGATRVTLSARLQGKRDRLKQMKEIVQLERREIFSEKQRLVQGSSELQDLRQRTQEAREKLVKMRKQLLFRQKQLVIDMYSVFPISQNSKEQYQIRDMIILSPRPSMISAASEKELSVALGFTAQLVAMIAFFSGNVLKYPITVRGSTSEMLEVDRGDLRDGERRFPLYGYRADPEKCNYAIFMLERCISQLRYAHARKTADPTKPLRNMLQLVSAKYFDSEPSSGHNTTSPHRLADDRGSVRSGTTGSS